MKKLLLLSMLSFFVSCDTTSSKDPKNEKASEVDKIEAEVEEVVEEEQSEEDELVFTENDDFYIYGEEFSPEDVLDAQTLAEKYASMKVGDSLPLIAKANVNSVCKKKGCWMKLDLAEEQEAMVRFKDYGFFVPKDIDGNEVIVSGHAFIEETSVEDLKHYAEDDGQSEEEIAAITEPKQTLSFQATGVLLAK